MHKKLTENFDYKFDVSKSGIYAIPITASCKSGKFFGLWGEGDLRVEIDGIKLREIPAKKKSQYYDIPSAWNGTKLKGLSKTVIFITELKVGKHIVTFIPKGGANLEKEPEITRIENPNKFTLNLKQQAQDGNRRPWVTIVLIDFPLSIIDASVICNKRKCDSDDVKIIIDNKIQKHETLKWGKNWFWQGRQLKGKVNIRRFYLHPNEANHYIEFWADRTPTLNEIKIYLGIIKGVRNCGNGYEKEELEEKIYKDPSKITEKFNEEYVIKDSTFNDKDSMNKNEIQEFLNNHHEVKGKIHVSKMNFNGKTVAHWIKKASEEYSINPKLLLVKLQVEQRLIKGEKAINPSEKQLNGAMGVGMFDDDTIVEELQGFVNQINYAAKYFRQYFNEANDVDFIHKDVDGKELKAVNAATYSLYRYTPHIAGAKLVYNVYKMFFGTEDLGGSLEKETEKNNAGNVSLKLLCKIMLPVLIILAGLYFVNKYRQRTIFTWENEINLENNGKVITELKIFSEKNVTEKDGPYCGFRFGKIYESTAKLFLSYDNKIVDSTNLTNPELVISDFTEESLTYYKPYDIDGDGEKKEFVIQEYSSCNGNQFSFIRVNKILQKIEKIPIIYQNGSEGFELYVDIGESAFNVQNGNIKVKFYDATQGEFSTNYYKFDKISDKLEWVQKL